MMKKHTVLFPALALFGIFSLRGIPSYAAEELVSQPAVFDFGWAPLNAKIFADFDIKNASTNSIDVSEVRPSCGCTAANFVPSTLAPGQSMPLSLSFNTRGYQKRKFHKGTTVKNGDSLNSLSVDLAGYVQNPAAVFKPEGTGILAFSEKDKDDKKNMVLKNLTAESLKISVIQKPAEWAGWNLSSNVIPSSGTVKLEIFVSPPFDELRETSLTLEAAGKKDRHRATVAVRSGEETDRPRLAPSR